MPVPSLRAVSICRKCAEVFLPEESCACEGGSALAPTRTARAAPRRSAAEAAWFDAPSAARPVRRAVKLSAAFFGVALFAALLLILAALTKA